MPRPTLGRRSLVALLGLCLAAPAVSDTRAQDGGQARPYSRIERLELWSAALERHQPGEADDALRVFSGWTARDLGELKITLSSTLQLIRDPSTRIFWRPPSNDPRSRVSSTRAVQVLYSLAELRELIAIASRLARLGHNHVLKRAAMLHTDAVLFGAGDDTSRRRRRTDSFVIRLSDGQEVNQEDSVGHLDMARFALDRIQRAFDDVQPSPASDGWVRRWYRTVMTHMIGRVEYNVAVANRGVDLFRNDPELLFLRAVMHETMASPAIQEALGDADFDLRTLIGLSTRRGELNAAEDLLRRALKTNPTFTEARLHLGRVLAELGRHKDALPELTKALPSIQDPSIEYYGQMFLGRSAAATGAVATARAAFERASTLAPDAQSPLLALSQLAYARGEAGEAAALLARVSLPPVREGGDPWWVYHAVVGRYHEVSREDLVTTLRAEMPR